LARRSVIHDVDTAVDVIISVNQGIHPYPKPARGKVQRHQHQPNKNIILRGAGELNGAIMGVNNKNGTIKNLTVSLF